MSTKIPEIARKVSPEECRELIEFLLGGPLKNWKAGVGREVVDKPTEDQRKQDHVELSRGRILLLHNRAELHFETDWHPRGDKRLTAGYEVRATYLGAMADGSMMHGGATVECHKRWQELLKGAGSPVADASPGFGRFTIRVAVEAVVRGAINRVVDNLDKLKDLVSGG